MMTKKSVEKLKNQFTESGIEFYMSDAWAEGGNGCLEAAAALVEKCEIKSKFNDYFPYRLDYDLETKIEALARNIYGASKVEFLPKAKKKLDEYFYYPVPICVAKTQYSFSDDPKLLGAPSDFTLTVRDLKYCSGAGFIVVYCGDIMTMPGLFKEPAAENIDVDNEGNIVGIF